jgi:hypothetical protein
VEEALGTLEPTLLALAHKYHQEFRSKCDGRFDISPEDFAQEGRIRIAMAYSINTDPGYLLRSARNGIINYARSKSAKKNHPARGIQSLSAPFGNDPDKDSRTYEDVIACIESVGSSDTLSTLFEMKFGPYYSAKLASIPNSAEIVNRLIYSIGPSNNSNAHLTRRFFGDNRLLPILRRFYDNSSTKARAILYPNLDPRPSRKIKRDYHSDAWADAASVVTALWNSSEPIPDLEPIYKAFTPNGEEALASRSHRAELIPGRSGYAFLLHEGLGMSLNGVVRRMSSFSDPSSVLHATANFEAQCKTRGITFPQKDVIPYSWRVVCNLLSTDATLSEVPFPDLLDTYTFRLGLTSFDLTKENREQQLAHARAGFFYILDKRLGELPLSQRPSQTAALESFGFKQDRTLVSKQKAKVAQVLHKWRQRNGLENMISQPAEDRQLTLPLALAAG